MRVVVTFNVTNRVSIEAPFIVEKGNKAYHIHRKDGLLAQISVIFKGVCASEAPKISSRHGPTDLTSISVTDAYSLLAERDVRSWQSILAGGRPVEIDFNTKETSYHAETPEEAEAIKLTSFKVSTAEYEGPPPEDFSMFGRAFLAIEDHYDEIDKAAFYLEGVQHLRAGHCIDAYNLFYLFLEANYSLPFKTAPAIHALLANNDYKDALQKASEIQSWDGSDSTLTLKGISPNGLDVDALTKSIVSLRGHLRHNTLSNPKRWDPHNQDAHRTDAVFLAMACQILSRKALSSTFEPKYADEFLRLAMENNHMTRVLVTITMKDLGAPRPKDVQVEMNFPTIEDSPNLAKTVLQNTLEMLDNKVPGAEIYAIRAKIQNRGDELFRYDLGPSIGRK